MIILIKSFVIAVAIIAACSIAAAQDTTSYPWKVQFPPLDFSHPVRLTAVSDSLIMYLSEGFILRSSDAGATWSRINLPLCFTPKGVQFLNDSLGFIVGDRGTVYKTTDGGLTWNYKRLSVSATDLTGVSFSSPKIGWVSGLFGLIYKTTDGGDNWFAQGYLDFFKGGSECYMSVHAISDSVVWATRWFRVLEVPVGDPNCSECYYLNVNAYRSSDGGSTWLNCRTWDVMPEDAFVDRNQHGFLRDFSSVFDCSANHASLFFRPHFNVDNWYLYTTDDAGIHWDSVSKGTNPVNRYVKILDCGTAWATDSARSILFRSVSTTSLDWKARSFPCDSPCVPYTFDFIDTLTGWCFTDNGNRTVTVYRTTDGALTWQPMSTHVLNRGTLVDVKFINKDIGWAAGNDSTHGLLMKTTDQGSHWNILNTTGAPLHNIKQIQFIDTLTGWMRGDSLYSSRDGGKSWTVDGSFPLDPARPQIHYVWAQFVSPATGWMVRSDWMTFRTADSGATWQQVHDRDTAVNISIAHAVDANNLICMGTVDSLAYEFRLINAGASVQQFELKPDGNTPTMAKAIFFLDSLRGWFVDTMPNVYITSDGGFTWTFLSFDPSLKPITSIFYNDSANGWMTTGRNAIAAPPVGDLDPYITSVLISSGGIEKTSNAGTGITAEHCILQAMTALDFVGDSLGWAVGENLTVYHYFQPASGKPKRRPLMSLSTPVIEFGDVKPGTVGVDSVIVRNDGDDTLVVYGATTPNDKYHAFNVATLLPQSIAPGDTTVLYINFDPAYYIIFSATLFIQSNDDTQYVYLHGTGKNPNGIHGAEPVTRAARLIQNYPNPFSTSTTLVIDPTLDGISSLKISNALGEIVGILPVEHSREIPFNAGSLPAGNYFVEARVALTTVRERVVVAR